MCQLTTKKVKVFTFDRFYSLSENCILRITNSLKEYEPTRTSGKGSIIFKREDEKKKLMNSDRKLGTIGIKPNFTLRIHARAYSV